MSHISQNLAALSGGPPGLTDPLLYHVTLTQESMTLVPGDGAIICRGAAPLTMTLPQSRTCEGRAFLIVNTTGNTITVATQDPHDQINAGRSVALPTKFTALLALSDGQSWWGLPLV